MSWQDYPTLQLLTKAAKKLAIDYQIVGKLGFIRFQKGPKLAYIYRTKTPLNSYVAVYVSESKYLTSKILRAAGLPTQKYHLFRRSSSALKFSRRLGFPLVVKPNVGSQGNGVTANIQRADELLAGVELAQKFHPTIVLSSFFPGEDYRLLVLNHQVIAAIKRRPPQVTGDGKKTISQLIREKNQKRRIHHLIKIDNEAKRVLKKKNYQLDSILPRGKTVVLRANANWSTGGTVQTIKPEKFHPTIIQTALKASRILTLNLAAIDFILQDPQRPIQNNGIILEVNANPGIGIFHQPASGAPQKVSQQLLKAMLKI